jgi:dsRNA-specific ribonuclease
VSDFTELRAFQERLGYVFRDGGLLTAALRHASYSMTERHYVDKRGKLLPNFVFDAA